MVICFFSTQYLPTPGGVERYTWNLARRCVAAGHRALVVTASLPGLPARERDADGIEIYRLPSWPVMGGRFPVLKPLADADDLWAQGIDFAVIQTRMYTQSVWAARQCKRRGIPALVIDHSTGYMLHGGLAGALGKAYEHAACGSIRRCGFPFYGVSGDVCRWLKTFGIQAEGRLPNAVDPAELERLAHADNAVDWRRRLNVPADGRLVAFVGRLIPEKGALRLAQAVQGIPGCTLAVAGTGPEEAALAAAKYAAAYELAQLQQNGEGLTGHAKEAYDKALADAAAAIEAAKTPAEVDAALAAAREALNNAVCPSAAFTDVEENVWYHDGIDFMVRNGYMNGVAADTFDVEGSLTRAQLVTILYRIAGEPETSAAIPFADVADGQWYTKAIVWAAENGIVKGVNETTFAPNDPITREQIAVILYRYAHEENTEDGKLTSFPDAKDISGYALEAMNWAVARGLINGSDGKLLPQDTATRAQIAVILARYLNA